jgi:ferric-dicitrate binding protein FerR (iron transport regulator)
VLGTSFIVHAPSEHERIAVQVKTGKVAVRRRQDDTGVVLTPNQQVTFDPAKKRLAPSLVEKPVLLIGADKTREVYDDVGIDRVLADISQAYGIDIIASEKIRSKRITTAFVDEGLYDRLDILTRAIGARYRVDGTQIRIESQEH